MGRFVVGPGHRLQCKMPNCTKHKFPGYEGPEDRGGGGGVRK